MSLSNIKPIIMKRDNLTSDEADELISEAQEALQEYILEGDLDNAYDICQEYFGLEPDYLNELI